MATGEKAPGAFKTIGELSRELGVAQHILRYWETKFSQLKPLQRAGNRRYYRPDDVQLAKRINQLLNQEGYTVRGVQKLLGQRRSPEQESLSELAADYQPGEAETRTAPRGGVDIERLAGIRDRLAEALGD
ncbi:MAG: MerR family transcriptional regulator [Sphingomonas sp.]|nr:MerR family transcriptional regulator [Sphingomonas sp.]